MFGPIWHAIWAGIPLGLCALAFTPPWLVDTHRQASLPVRQRQAIREDGHELGNPRRKGRSRARRRQDTPGSTRATTTSSRSTTRPRSNGELVRRTLVLDNLIHGYFMLGHPERLDYDYEHIYALVAYRAAKASGKLTHSRAGGQAPREGRAPRRPRSRHQEGRRRRRPKEPSAAERRSNEPAGAKNADRGGHQGCRRATKPPGGLQSVQAPAATARTTRQDKESFPSRALEPTTSTQPLTRARTRTTARCCPPSRIRRMKTLVPGRRRLLLPAAHAVCLSRHRGRRRRDRPQRHPRQLHGDRAAARHHRSRPTGATPASSSTCTRTPRNTTSSSATRSTTSRFPGISPRSSSTRSSRKCSRPTAST